MNISSCIFNIKFRSVILRSILFERNNFLRQEKTGDWGGGGGRGGDLCEKKRKEVEGGEAANI